MNITLKDVPPELHVKLRKAAQRSGRSLNKQILHTLDHAVNPRMVNRAQLLMDSDPNWIAPRLWLDEFVNVLCTHERQGLVSRKRPSPCSNMLSC